MLQSRREVIKKMKCLLKKFVLFVVVFVMGASALQAKETLPTVYDLYREFIAQNGGQKNLESLNSVIIKGSIDQDEQKVNFRLYRKRPNKMRITIELENLEISTIYDGSQAWREVSSETDLIALTELKGDELATIKKDSIFDSPFHAAFDKRKYITVVGIEDVNGKEAVRLDFDPIGDFGYKSLWLSMDHCQEVKMLRPCIEDGVDAKKDEAIHYQGFERINGVYWANFMRHFVNGELTKEIHIEDVLPNAGVFDYYFEVDEARKADAQSEQ
jgi:outer membrane lipoprotein-sorting protein